MLIDWFTIAAQALNFLILVWLMRRFLYKPILNAIDAREKLIAKELAEVVILVAELQAFSTKITPISVCLNRTGACSWS